MITGAAWFIQMDEAHYPRAHEFDPWRFYDEKTNTATTKSTTATNTFLAFGYGSQSCPGRFLGVRLTQIVFAKMLMRYEFGWEDGQKGRPENVVLPGQLLPQYTATIVLRERAGV
jgi:cytochrome P450